MGRGGENQAELLVNGEFDVEGKSQGMGKHLLILNCIV